MLKQLLSRWAISVGLIGAAALALWAGGEWDSRHHVSPTDHLWKLAFTFPSNIQSRGGLFKLFEASAELKLDGEAGTHRLTVTPPPDNRPDALYPGLQSWPDPLPSDLQPITVVVPTFVPGKQFEGRTGTIFYHLYILYPGRYGLSQDIERNPRVDIQFTQPPQGFFDPLGRIISIVAFFILLSAIRMTRRYLRNKPPNEKLANGTVEAMEPERRRLASLHRRRGRFWRATSWGANALIIVAMCFGAYLAAELRTLFVWSVTIVPAWALAGWVRSRAANHLRLAAGYEQPTAEEILSDPAKVTNGFVVFLRGFELERSHIKYEGVNTDFGRREAELRARPIEALLVEVLAVPLVSLADPRTAELMAGAHRFSNPPEDWVALVEGLAQSARAIVMHFSSVTPGIATELALLRASSLNSKTVIIVDRGLGSLSNRSGISEAINGFEHVVFQGTLRPWSQSEERSFQKRLLRELAKFDKEDDKPLLTGNIPSLVTPTALSRALDFIRGPLIGSAVCSLILLFVLLFYALASEKSIAAAATEALNILVWWPVALGILILAKGYFLAIKSAGASGWKHGTQFGTQLATATIDSFADARGFSEKAKKEVGGT
jgi:hypothetical protein